MAEATRPDLHAVNGKRDDGDLLAVMQREPSGEAMLTGQAAIDGFVGDYLRGGHVLTLVGTPGAGKTGLALAIAHALLSQVDRVVVCALDRGGRGLVHRLARLDGITGNDAHVARTLASKYPQLVVRVDSLAAALAALQRGGKQLLVVDSIQRASLAYKGDEPRQRIELALADVERARSLGALVVLTSEASRGASAESIGGAKDSSSIEHAADCQLFLQADRGQHRRFCATLQKPTGLDAVRWFQLDTADRLHDVTAPAAQPAAPAAKPKATKRRRGNNLPMLGKAQLDAAVTSYVKEHPGCSGRDVCDGVKGSDARKREALQRVARQNARGGWHVD